MSTLTKSTIEHVNEPKKQKVLILGGGFGGIKTALQLFSSNNYDIQLISDQSNFRYYPTLYKTATGGNQNASIIALQEIFKDKPVSIIIDSAKNLNRNSKTIACVSGKSYGYDILVIALGVFTNFFGIKGLEKYAYGIKTLDEAQALRDHIHRQLVNDGQPDLNYVVIGGGASGVELAGALPGYIKHIMKRHGLTDRKLSIELVEAAPRLVPRMSTRYSRLITRRLRELGIKLYLKQTVQAETAEALTVSGQSIKSHCVIWTAGVTNHPFLRDNQFNLSDHGKAEVNEYLQAEDNIYVIGDNAETQYSGMAQTALRDAVYVADNLKRRSSGKTPKPYQAKKPVYVISIGPRWAAVSWGKFQFYGIPGWALRRTADLRAYHDLEPWWKASKHWLADSEGQETCPLCSSK